MLRSLLRALYDIVLGKEGIGDALTSSKVLISTLGVSSYLRIECVYEKS